jgi:hypothetical protein
MSSEAEARDYLHKITHFRQDTLLESVKALTNTGDIAQPIYSRVHEHVVAKIGGAAGLHTCVIEPRLGYAIANIRILGDNWSDASLVFGQTTNDRIKFPRHGNSFFLTDEGRCLPFVQHHNFKVEVKAVEVDSMLTIEYDIVEFPELPAASFRFPMKATIYPGDYTVSAGDKKVQMLLNNPVEAIHIDVLKGRVDSMSLVVETHEKATVTIPVPKISEDQFVLDFGEKTVNFSRLNDSYLVCDVSEEATVVPRATILNVLRSVSGMYGVMYVM